MIHTYQEAATLADKYPYFAYAMLQGVRLAPEADARRKMKERLSANIGDPIALREILHLNSESLANLYPDSLPPQLSTDQTIDSFIDRFGAPDMAADLQPAAPASIEELFPDEFPEKASEKASDSVSGGAYDFGGTLMTERKAEAPLPIEKEEKQAETPALTESFARILIKNKNYSKALTIIEELNLKNPEKSIYFADQIRFLKKLIINQSKKREPEIESSASGTDAEDDEIDG